MNSKGQTLIEVIVVMTVGILVVAALTFATIFSLRNAKFSQNQAQANKYAQEGLEKLRTHRDRGYTITNYPRGNSWKDSNFWNNMVSQDDSTLGLNYFIFNSDGISIRNIGNYAGTVAPYTVGESIENGKFYRIINLSDKSSGTDSYLVEKTATVFVGWRDAAAWHESKQTTILRKL